MEGYRFRNWAQTFECQPKKYFEPKNIDELREILKLAQNENRKIRMIGCGHSPNDLCLTDDFMVCTKKLNRILSLDEAKKTATVECGVLLTDLVKFLKNQNLALGVLPAIGEITVGGIVSTCTHGSGVQYPVLAGLLNNFIILTADDQLLVCSRFENSEIFHAVCGGLGTLGILIEMEFQCETYYNLKHTRYPMTLDDFIESVDELCQEVHHFKANYFPYADHVVVSSINRTKIRPTKRSPKLLRKFIDWFWNVFVLVYLFEFFYFLTIYASWMVKYVNKIGYWILFSDFDYCVGGYEEIAFFNCLFHQYVSEWTVERSLCGEALRRLKNAIEKNQIPAHFPIEIRFIRRDKFWLSPAYDRDICAINAVAYCPFDRKPPYEEYWKIYAHIMKSLNGRPHLGKGHNMSREDMKKAHPKFIDFLRLRKRLDRGNLFVNEHVERVFGNVDDISD